MPQPSRRPLWRLFPKFGAGAYQLNNFIDALGHFHPPYQGAGEAHLGLLFFERSGFANAGPDNLPSAATSVW